MARKTQYLLTIGKKIISKHLTYESAATNFTNENKIYQRDFCGNSYKDSECLTPQELKNSGLED